VLYLLFINGFIEKIHARNLGVSILSTRTGKRMWIGALMYCDDAVVVGGIISYQVNALRLLRQSR
jgi:hypothetical protein